MELHTRLRCDRPATFVHIGKGAWELLYVHHEAKPQKRVGNTCALSLHKLRWCNVNRSKR